MNGADFLLDTNIVLGVLQGYAPALALVEKVSLEQCAYSPVTRMELLGFPGITTDESSEIEALLASLRRLPLDKAVEAQVIQLRQQRKIKLPDAIIAATALVHEVKLMTLDKKLLAAYQSMEVK